MAGTASQLTSHPLLSSFMGSVQTAKGTNNHAKTDCPVLYHSRWRYAGSRRAWGGHQRRIYGTRGWQAPYLDEFLGKVLDEQWREPFDLLLGRKTVEIFASNFPSHEEQGPGPGINNATKYVASNTLHSHDWKKSVFLKGDVAEEVRKLKQQDGPDIQVDGRGNLIQTLLKYDLIDGS